jgi:DNA-binding GntR family transcriptional regulator
MGEEIDRLGATPVYVQVVQIIRARIESGKLKPNRPIPSEAQMEQEFGIARETARKAVALLREEGLIVTVRGRGSFVAER